MKFLNDLKNEILKYKWGFGLGLIGGIAGIYIGIKTGWIQTQMIQSIPQTYSIIDLVSEKQVATITIGIKKLYVFGGLFGSYIGYLLNKYWRKK